MKSYLLMTNNLSPMRLTGTNFLKMRQQHRIIYLLLIVAIQFSACKNKPAPKKDVTKRSTSKVEQPLRSAEKPSNAYEERVEQAEAAVRSAEKQIRDYNEECRKQEEEQRKELEKRTEAVREQAKKQAIEDIRRFSEKLIRKYEEAIRDCEEEIKRCQEKQKIQRDRLASIAEIEKEKRSRGEAITTEAVDKITKIASKIVSLEKDIEMISEYMARMDIEKKEIEDSLGHEEELFETYKRKYSKKPS